MSTSPKSYYRSIRRKLNKGIALNEFDREHPCVFFLSTGRVGTQTLASLCSLARNVDAFHEPFPLLYAYSKHSYLHGDDARVAEILRDVIDTMRSNEIKTCLASGRGYVETSPQLTFLAPFLLECWPQARFIHVVRDPRDVVQSGLRRKWYAGNGFDDNRIVPRQGSVEASAWDTYSLTKKNAWLWTETNRWIGNFMDTLAEHQGLTLCSESLFAGESDTMTALFDMLSSSVPQSSRIGRVLDKRLNAQTSGNLTSTWKDSLQADLEDIALPTMTRYGYTL